MERTYAEIKRRTLELVNQSTVAGAQIASSYNNQADYLKRIPALINTALTNILTLVKRDPVLYTLTTGEEYGDMIRYTLPSNFYSLKTGGVSVLRGGAFLRTNEYKMQGKKYILIPKEAPGVFTVEYYRYPNYLKDDPADEDTVDEDPEVLDTAQFYAAAMLVMQEDEFAYATLYNDYESRLSRISPGIAAEVGNVEDEYGFGGFGGWMS